MLLILIKKKEKNIIKLKSVVVFPGMWGKKCHIVYHLNQQMLKKNFFSITFLFVWVNRRCSSATSTTCLDAGDLPQMDALPTAVKNDPQDFINII